MGGSSIGMSSSTPTMTPGGYREAIQIAWPLVISMGSFTIMQFFDRMFLAWYSPVAIQAALPAGIFCFTMICGFMALSGYANTFVAQYHGSQNPIGCSRATMQGVWLALGAWPILIALIPIGRFLLSIAGHAPEVLEQELIYFTLLMSGGVVIPLGAAISSFFTGRGDTLTNMYATIAGYIVNILLDYALIFGWWLFPELGIRGAAIATILGGLIHPAILFALYFGRRIHAVYQTRTHAGIHWPLMKRLIQFGFPSGLHLALDIGSFSVFVLMTGRMNALDLAVSNMALSINTVAFLPLIGISIAATTLVGQYQGRGRSDLAEKSGWSTFKIGVFYVSCVGLTFVSFPTAYFQLFVAPDSTFALDEVVSLGRWLLIMMAIWGGVDVGNLVLSGALKGAGDTRFVMIYSVIAAWGFMVPGVLLITFVLDGGILLLWAWVMTYIMVLAIGYIYRFWTGKWKSIQILETPPAILATAPPVN